jgi:hypothetical protein
VPVTSSTRDLGHARNASLASIETTVPKLMGARARLRALIEELEARHAILDEDVDSFDKRNGIILQRYAV